MLKKILKALLGQSHKHHYSSSDYHKRNRHYYKGHHQYGHGHYKKKHSSRSFFSSFLSS